DQEGGEPAAADGPALHLVIPRQRGWDGWQPVPPPAPRRGWIGRALVAVLLAVGVGVAGAGAYAARSFAADEQANQPDRSTFVGALDQTGRDRAVAAILDRRARAVREHRKDLFLADVDRTNTALMAAQGSLYDHLTVIPFGELKFVVHPDLTYDLAEPP